MAEKTGYRPGDIASFLSKTSTKTAESGVQVQLQAMFDNQVRIKPVQTKTVTSAPPAGNSPDKVVRKTKKRSATESNESSKGDKESLEKFEKPSKRVKKSSDRTSASIVEETAASIVEETAASIVEETAETEVEKEENSLIEKNKRDRTEQRNKAKLAKKISKENEIKNERTVFVGNVALSVTKKRLMKLFEPFGKVETVRIRSVPVSTEHEPNKKLAPVKARVIKKQLDPDRHSMNAYIVFETEESAKGALVLNGSEVDDFHIRVDLASVTKKHDFKTTIFVGNLPFKAEEEALRKHLEACGAIENVRIIRNKTTGVGKGFGYVKFSEPSAVKLALTHNGQDFLGRELRIKKAMKKPKKPKFTDKVMKSGRKGETTRGNTKPRAKKSASLKSGRKEEAMKTMPTVKTSKKPNRPLKKVGDMSKRLTIINRFSETGRKERHQIKKVMREALRQKKKSSTSRILTGGKNNN